MSQGVTTTLSRRRSGEAGALPFAALLRDIPDLPRELERLLGQVPAGRVTTYGDLARALGDVGAARWVGEHLLAHSHDEPCRCHRVVRVDGDIGLYITGNAGEKVERLRRDRVPVAGGRVDLDRFRFHEFHSSAPLAALREWQLCVPDQLKLAPLTHAPQRVGGVDVSYISRTEAVASFVLVDVASLELVWSTSVRAAVTFPYLSGYLSFRELPILLKLFGQVCAAKKLPDVTFVDGNGILHPRRAGSASCFGLAAGIPTIGVGKKLLCGRVEGGDSIGTDARPIVHNDEELGFVMQTGSARRPFFVSPGHLVDLPATLYVTRLVLGDRRLPMPIVLADRESRREAARIKAMHPSRTE
ncbi:MAG: endonuclease V [Planctomycetaceae bacterium]